MDNPERLDCFMFGRRLVETRDLDPVYVALWEARLPPLTLRRWLVAYWCFYHVGTASWTVDGELDSDAEYWRRMEAAARSPAYPRCPERRHFRGKAARESVAYLKARGIGSLPAKRQKPLPLAEVLDHIQQWRGFGPWIAFKAADMLERLDIFPIRFDNGAMFLFDAPREGAELLWDTIVPRHPSNDRANQSPKTVRSWAVHEILTRLSELKAPPRYERALNCQEAETILCKWKSHCGGRYQVGHDIAELYRGLNWNPGPTAEALKAGAEKGGLVCLGS